MSSSRRGLAYVAGAASILAIMYVPAGAAALPDAPQAAHEKLGSISIITNVPDSNQAFAIGRGGNGGCIALRRRSGRWASVPPPNIGASSDGCSIYALGAGSSSTIWAAGATGSTNDSLPAIWRWSGGKFGTVALPDDVVAGEQIRIESLSASSTRNAWAVGRMADADNAPIALHWNGSKWSAVPVPGPTTSIDTLELTSVSTSGPSNAWALGSTDGGYHNSVYRWNGSTWSIARSIPTGTYPNGVVTGSPSLTYVVGRIPVSVGHNRSYALKYNGTSWSRTRFAADVAHVDLFDPVLHGTTAWAVGADDEYHAVVLVNTNGKWRRSLSLGSNYRLTALSQVKSHQLTAVGFHAIKPKGKYAVSLPYRYITKYDGHRWREVPVP